MSELNLIVFFVPPKKIVNGGIMSIFSVASVSRQLEQIHGSQVYISTYPGSPSYGKNDLFKNDEIVHTFDEIVKKGRPRKLQIHIPEYASLDVYYQLKKYESYLRSVKDLRVNIMNQNTLLMPDPAHVAYWFRLTPHVTQTTAHGRYATQAMADKYNLPTMHLSVFIDPRQYIHLPYEKKQNIIAVSPDEAPLKQSIIEKLKAQLPNFRIKVIKNLTYEQYKQLIAKAKFTFTFGEGFDGYFIEPFFSGSIAFAVFNKKFFPDPQFLDFKNLYSDYEQMLHNIISDMKTIDNKNSYEALVAQNFEKLSRIYDYSVYTDNVKKFYLGEFTYMPSKDSQKNLIEKILQDKEKVLADKDKQIADINAALIEKEKAITDKDKQIADINAALIEKENIITGIYNSKSWKLTKPLRRASSLKPKKD